MAPGRLRSASLLVDAPHLPHRHQQRERLLSFVKQQAPMVHQQLRLGPSFLRGDGPRHASSASITPSKPFRPQADQALLKTRQRETFSHYRNCPKYLSRPPHPNRSLRIRGIVAQTSNTISSPGTQPGRTGFNGDPRLRFRRSHPCPQTGRFEAWRRVAAPTPGGRVRWTAAFPGWAD